VAQSGPWPHSWGFVIAHNDAAQSVGLLRTNYNLIAETSDNTEHSQETHIHVPSGIQTHDLSRRGAADPRLILRGCEKTSLSQNAKKQGMKHAREREKFIVGKRIRRDLDADGLHYNVCLKKSDRTGSSEQRSKVFRYTQDGNFFAG
jgi:hypothetical protein